MRRYRVRFSANAKRHLDELWNYVAKRSGEEDANHLIAVIIADCEGLAVAPHRGIVRTQYGPDLRVIGAAKGRVSVAFRVGRSVVSVASIRYAGWKLSRRQVR